MSRANLLFGLATALTGKSIDDMIAMSDKPAIYECPCGQCCNGIECLHCGRTFESSDWQQPESDLETKV